jgi:hypothetical protein
MEWTVMPYSHVLESEKERLRPFRRALSREGQEAFDRLFDRVKMHTNAGVYMACPWPMETILLSICLELGKMIEEILGKLKESSRPILNIVDQAPTRIINAITVNAVKERPVFRIDPVTIDSGYKSPAGIVHPIVFQVVS